GREAPLRKDVAGRAARRVRGGFRARLARLFRDEGGTPSSAKIGPSFNACSRAFKSFRSSASGFPIRILPPARRLFAPPLCHATFDFDNCSLPDSASSSRESRKYLPELAKVS